MNGTATLIPQHTTSETLRGVEDCLSALLSPAPGLPGGLLEAMRYSALAPGKRIRPLLVVLAARAVAGRLGLASPALDPFPAACAVEMVHVYSLVHDDLPAMDDDDLRRGQPTCHRKYGEAMAILAGDALLTRAFEVLAQAYPGSVGGEACLELALAAGGRGMVGGQVVDLAAEGKLVDGHPPQTLEDLESLHRRKTGELIRVALRLGWLVATPVDRRCTTGAWKDELDQFGRDLGLAFQITDDLLDVEGHEDKAGKRVGKDAAKGKLTYPGLLGVEASRQRAAFVSERGRAALDAWGAHADALRALADKLLARDT